MKALKINSGTQKIEEVTIKSWKDIAPEIGNGCEIFTAPIELENMDTLYADDEGLYNSFEGGFMMEDWSYPIVGNGLLVGTNEEGESVNVKTTKEELEKMIIWVSKADAQKHASQF